MDDRWVRRCTRLLRDLIAIPSVNPADRTAYDREIYGERGVTDYMARYFAAFDYDLRIRTVPVLPERENVIVEAGGDEDEATLLLETHADTVEGAGMDTPPFQPVSKGDLLFGRGACDAKGQLAAMTIGLEMALAETNGDLPTPVRLALVVDEEHLHRGVDRLIEEGSCRGTRAIVGEPTGLRLSSALKGCIRFKIATLGVSAHTSIPHAGSNAIYLMSKVVRTIEEKVAPAVAEKRHDLCGQATISVSVIRGGRQVNIVPDHCEIDVDRRLNPGEEWEGAYRDIIDRITSALSGSERDRVRFVDPYLIDPAMETDTTSDIVASLAAVLHTHGLPDTPVGLPFGCDASKIARSGVPTVVFGPGSIADAHSRTECISMTEVMTAAAVYRDLIMNPSRVHGAGALR